MRGILTEDLEVGRNYACMVVSNTTELNNGNRCHLKPEILYVGVKGHKERLAWELLAADGITSTSSYMAPLDFNGVSDRCGNRSSVHSHMFYFS